MIAELEALNKLDLETCQKINSYSTVIK